MSSWLICHVGEQAEEPIHLVLLPRRHVLEVATAVDDLPELLRLDAPELLADRLEPLAILTRHVVRDLLRARFRTRGQVVTGELDLRLADALQARLLPLEAQRL